uniref:Uncharacterized protein n=1 Tax=Schizaphis graminum TaxID=13262 RepID=A0A2S2P151_SCHGA
MGKGSSSDRARTRTTIDGHAAAAAVASDASTSTAAAAVVVVVQAVMRIPPSPSSSSSSQTSSRPGIATRKSEGGIFRLRVDDRGGGARETRERAREKGPKRAARGEQKNPTPCRHPSAPADRFLLYFSSPTRPFCSRLLSRITLYYIFFFRQADLRSINDNHNKGVVERT